MGWGSKNQDQAGQPKKPPDKFCPVKGCGKKMAAFKRGSGWEYICPDEAKHAQDKLKAKAAGPSQGKGGVKKGTPSPLRGTQQGNAKPYRTRYDWTRKRRRPKDEGGK